MRLFLISAFMLSLSALPQVNADTLLLPAIAQEPENALEGVPRPKPGMTAKKVAEIFGKPITRSEAIGNPPISRWTYKGFIVVLENDRVINSVIRKPAQEAFVEN